ncbi:MAG: hypothetical protein ACREHG_09815 [Candidatus Saccharimonadales bacterium]
MTKTKTHYTRAEAEQKLRELSDSEIDKITLYSEQISALARGAYDSRELLNEAYARTLDGSRRWKCTMGGPEHLFGVMRSIQNSWLKSDKRAKAGHKALIQSVEINEEAVVTEWPVEQLVELQTRISLLLKSRKLNLVEKCVLSGFSEGLEPKDILDRCRITSKRYIDTLLRLGARISSNTSEKS